MKLYTDNNGRWAGTQSDAKRDFGHITPPTEVPTDKPTLLKFLNDHAVATNTVIVLGKGSELRPTTPPLPGGEPAVPAAAADATDASDAPAHPLSCSAYKPARDLNQYDVRDVVLNCDKQHLASALGAIISRLHDLDA